MPYQCRQAPLPQGGIKCLFLGRVHQGGILYSLLPRWPRGGLPPRQQSKRQNQNSNNRFPFFLLLVRAQARRGVGQHTNAALRHGGETPRPFAHRIPRGAGLPSADSCLPCRPQQALSPFIPAGIASSGREQVVANPGKVHRYASTEDADRTRKLRDEMRVRAGRLTRRAVAA